MASKKEAPPPPNKKFIIPLKTVLKNPAHSKPSLVSVKGVSKGVGNIATMVFTGTTTHELPDTSAPLIDNKLKEIDQSCVFMGAIFRGMKKQQKHLKQYIESSEELHDALQFYLSDDLLPELTPALDLVIKYETFYRTILNDLSKHNSKVQDAIENFISKTAREAKGEKKKFDNQRRLLDETNLKISKTDGSAGGEKGKAKLKELQQEKEDAEALYLKQGEKTYNDLLDMFDVTKFFFLGQLSEHLKGYEDFFKQGQDYVVQQHSKIDELKEKNTKDQATFHATRPNRPKLAWAPSTAGDNKRVFAMNYQQVIDRDKPPGFILPFLDKCFLLLEEQGLTTTGIFRVSPPKPALDALREKIDKGLPLPVEEIDEIHMVSGLVKLFLRSLPNPLLTFELYKEWLDVVELPKDEQVGKIKELVLKLPNAHRILLDRLIYLCTRILEHQNENKMTVENLAIVLCPSILYDRDPDPLTMVGDIHKSNGILIAMVLHYRAIFEGVSQGLPRITVPPTSLPPSLPPSYQSLGNLPPTDVPPPPSIFATAPPSIPCSPPSTNNANATNPATVSSNSSSAGSHRTGLPATPTNVTATSLAQAAVASVRKKEEHLSIKPKKAEEIMTTTPPAGVESSTESSIEEEDTELKIGNRFFITLSPPPLSLTVLYQMVVDKVEPTNEYYLRLFELFDGTFMFTRAALGLSDLTLDELNLMNNAFQQVGKAIKNMLTFMKEYTSKFPSEVGKRIIVAANKVRPHIKSLITYIKAFNAGQKLDPSGLLQATRAFLIGTYQMYLTCNRASQMDELSQSAFKCIEIIKELNVCLKESQNEKGSVLLNNLQNVILKFTSLLRSRLPDISNSSLQETLSQVVENSEACIGELFDEAREMLEANNLHLTPDMSNKINALQNYINKVLSLRPDVEESIAADVDLTRMIEYAVEQLESICELHSDAAAAETDSNLLQPFIQTLQLLLPAYKDLLALHLSAPDNPLKWMEACMEVISIIQNLRGLVQDMSGAVEDESLMEVMHVYVATTEHLIIQFKITAAAAAFGIRLNGFETDSFAVPLKDFAFLTYPFMYNMQEVVGAMAAAAGGPFFTSEESGTAEHGSAGVDYEERHQ